MSWLGQVQVTVAAMRSLLEKNYSQGEHDIKKTLSRIRIILLE